MEPPREEAIDAEDALAMRQYTELNEVEGDIQEESTDPEYKEIDYLKSDCQWDDIGVTTDLKLLLWGHGIRRPSKIQAKVMKLFMSPLKSDILAQSQNGSGKTLAFLVPSILIAKEWEAKLPRPAEGEGKAMAPLVVIFSDTKELCVQTYKVAKMYSAQEAFKPSLLLKEAGDVEFGANVLVTTMGTFFHFLNKKQIILDRLRLVVLDETDKLLTQDFGKTRYPPLVKRITEKHPDTRIAMFSATFPQACLDLIKSLNRKLVQIVTQKQDIQLRNLTHYFVKCGRKGKLEFIGDFFEKFSSFILENSVIIFVNSKNFADSFGSRLMGKGYKCTILTSQTDPEKRQVAMEDFRAGKVRVLITTNLLSRGIDNRKVSVVINLDIPFVYGSKPKLIDSETYLHRVGRTGRFGDKGVAINVVENQEDFEEMMRLKKDYGLNLIELTRDSLQDVVYAAEHNLEYNAKKREYLEENI